MSDRGRRLLARARQELPEPGDPAQLIQDLASEGLAGPESLQVLARTSVAWRQLRDLRLERSWQGGFGWFLARNVILFAFLALLASVAFRIPPLALQSSLAGAGALYLLCMALAPLRLRRHRHLREAIRGAYHRDLSEVLEQIEKGSG